MPSSLMDRGPAVTPLAGRSARRAQIVRAFAACGFFPVLAALALGPGRFAPLAGLFFSLSCTVANYLTRPRQQLERTRTRTLLAIALGALGQPLVGFFVLLVLLIVRSVPHRTFVASDAPGLLGALAVGSVLSAVLAIGAAALWARKVHRPALFAMLIVGLLWPLTLFLAIPLRAAPLGDVLFPADAFLLVAYGPAMTAAWHLPMATLTGWWLSRTDLPR